MDKLLHTYWIVFKDPPSVLQSGCGITAYSFEDAQILLSQTWLGKPSIPEIDKVIEDIKFADLEQNHVAPNIGVMTNRGIWYPKI